MAFGQAVREAVIAGKDVIFYKAGRTPEGKTATSGHTASLAGDYMVCESCVRQAGGIVAQNFSQFEDVLMLSQRLHSKTDQRQSAGGAERCRLSKLSAWPTISSRMIFP